MNGPRQLEQPIYQQVANVLRAVLTDAPATSPKPLELEQDLADSYGVAPGTMHRALEILQSEGLVRQAEPDRFIAIPEGIRVWRHSRQDRCILIIGRIPRPPTSYYGQVFQGILSTAEAAGYASTIRYLSDPYAVRTPEMMPEDPQQVLGVMIIEILGETVIAMHAEAGYPVVCVDHWPAHPYADAVVTDCFTEGQQAVEYLVSQGHREMFFLGKMFRREPRQEYLYEVDSLLVETGYRYATCMAGLARSSERVRSFHQNQPFYTELVESLLAEKPRPTAGVIYNLMMAERLRETLLDCNLRCPEEISLLSRVDNLAITDFTSLRTDPLKMGRMAVEVVLARASGRQAPGMRVSVTSSLTPGATVAAISLPH